MSQINLKTIQSGDALSTVVDKLNYNFDQIVLNGGGAQGLRGIIGPPNLPGLQGRIGSTGPQGSHGTYIFTDGATPGDYVFGLTGNPMPRVMDIYIETDPFYLKVWELQSTGWLLVETITAPSSDWLTITHQTSGPTGPEVTVVINDINAVSKMFLGSTSAMQTGADPDQHPYFLSNSFSNKLVASLSLPQLYANSLLTLASDSNQIRILANNLQGATGALGGTSTSTPSILTNRGGVVHSLSGYNVSGATVQIYRIVNGDSDGDKFFSLGLNKNTKLLYGDMLNRLGVGVTEFEQLKASLSVNKSLAIGLVGFYTNPTLLYDEGIVSHGNLAIGINNNSLATGTIYGSTASSSFLIDVDSSVALPNSSSLTISSNFVQGSSKNYWRFTHDAQSAVLNSNYGSFELNGFRSGLTAPNVGATANVFWMSLTASSTVSAPRIGVNNRDPYSLLEIGSGYNRISIGEVFGDVSTDYITNYIGFNMHRSPVLNNWFRRGDSTYNAGKVMWSSLDAGLNISFFGSTGGGLVSSMTDSQVVQNTRFSVDKGALRLTEYSQSNDVLGASSIGLFVGFGATGTTGTSLYSGSWRRPVALFGRSVIDGSIGSPMIFTTNGETQSFSIISDGSSSILPHYSFYGVEDSGVYLAHGTTANYISGSGFNSYSVGLAIGGTSGISLHMANGIPRIGIDNINPYEKLHIGKKLVYSDTLLGKNFIGYNISIDGGGDDTRIYGSTAGVDNMEGYVALRFPELGLTSTNTSLSRFTNVGTKFSIELGNLGSKYYPESTWSIPSPHRLFRGVIMSPPLVGPTATHTNYATFVPQIGIGIPLDYTPGTTGWGQDSATTAKRGTLAIGAQYRTKSDGGFPPYIFTEDVYNIGLYTFDGFPVHGIGASSDNSTLKSITHSFLGTYGDVVTDDIVFLHGDTDISLTNNFRKRAYFGNFFRVGINHTPQSLTYALNSANCYGLASLVVTANEDVYDVSNPATLPYMKTASINHGSVVIDQTTFDTVGNGMNEGLYFKDANLWTGIVGQQSGPLSSGNTRVSAIDGDTYPGDWGIQYARTGASATQLNEVPHAGLNFFKPNTVGGRGDGNAYLWLDDDGSVGIGTVQFYYTGYYGYKNLGTSSTWLSTGASPISARLGVSGNIACAGIYVQSDRRIKENINSLEGTLNKIMKLNPVSYNKIETPGFDEKGFIAQEIGEIFPEIVRVFKDDKLEGGKLSLEYNSFFAILTKGIQEQQELINEKDKKIKDLESKLLNIEKLLAKHNIL